MNEVWWLGVPAALAWVAYEATRGNGARMRPRPGARKTPRSAR